MSIEEPIVEVNGLVKYFYEEDSVIDRLIDGTGRFRDGDSLEEAFLGWEPTAVRAVDGLNFEIHEGETLGLVGESGCGKSTAGETILRLQTPTAGEVRFEGVDIFGLSGSELQAFRREAQVVFQDPFSSLDPRMTIGDIVQQPLDVHDWPDTDPAIEPAVSLATAGIDPERVSVEVADDVDKVVGTSEGTTTVNVEVRRQDGSTVDGDRRFAMTDDIVAEVREDLTVDVEQSGEDIIVRVTLGRSDATLRKERVGDLLERVGLSVDQLERYPHEFSGGQRQRIAIARALALEPEFIILDEPTSALDVSVQAQVLNLLEELQSEFNLTYLLISHDLSVIRHICDRVAVMYLGEIVEIGPAEEIFRDPHHPYTQALLTSVPRAASEEKYRDREPLRGDVPSPRDPPSGCRFRTRCPKIIPPEELPIEQETYREIADFRQRIAAQEISLEAVDDVLSGEIHERESLASEDRERFIRAQKARLFKSELDPTTDEVVSDALSYLFDEEWAAAAELLRGRFESVCERENPRLVGDPHPAACHLTDQS